MTNKQIDDYMSAHAKAFLKGTLKSDEDILGYFTSEHMEILKSIGEVKEFSPDIKVIGRVVKIYTGGRLKRIYVDGWLVRKYEDAAFPVYTEPDIFGMEMFNGKWREAK